MTPAEFQTKSGVSRETLRRLGLYADLLVKWQAKINLVGPDTLPDLWSRHILDSAQLFPLIPATAKRLVDLGSGAGFPGLVLAVMGAPDVHLVESDSRKCAFLREAARVTGTPVTIFNKRIEQVAGLDADVVTARALAPLGKLLDWAFPHLAAGGQCLFLKGRGAEDELTATAKEWNIGLRRIPSLTDPAGLVLQLHEVRRG
ncbi:16S rRNA (guanine(527)-N(7))-methyltransferase RsmG [Paramagnetospirillum kuznetsovii]|uniref:Ribosomal RNA small subunit methyltransferase G n=1 Tax=Paramagnetospirillum kuznetsovii TaxID=2053833 RepID=A0A364P2Z8_9PROT|nr:16S rRNA (guanine(527)-N(7))-methyltransferase RsmG [Paramagnetospirillum kuznetsovii]RAU23722.1 16S rRNA (guanine(527)-N(7))-methyltransferase RsmG [Paramagnetospirillum kuznetsovii]